MSDAPMAEDPIASIGPFTATVTGLVSVRLWKTLITPFFWPTKIRPSAANCITVGLVSPLRTTESRKPVGNTEAPAPSGPAIVTRPPTSEPAIPSPIAEKPSRKATMPSAPVVGKSNTAREAPTSWQTRPITTSPTAPIGREAGRLVDAVVTLQR